MQIKNQISSQEDITEKLKRLQTIKVKSEHSGWPKKNIVMQYDATTPLSATLIKMAAALEQFVNNVRTLSSKGCCILFNVSNFSTLFIFGKFFLGLALPWLLRQ